MVLIRNDDYWGQTAYLERILIRFITDDTARLTALKAGEIDLDTRLTPIQYARQTSGASFDSQLAKASVKRKCRIGASLSARTPNIAHRQVFRLRVCVRLAFPPGPLQARQ